MIGHKFAPSAGLAIALLLHVGAGAQVLGSVPEDMPAIQLQMPGPADMDATTESFRRATQEALRQEGTKIAPSLKNFDAPASAAERQRYRSDVDEARARVQGLDKAIADFERAQGRAMGMAQGGGGHGAVPENALIVFVSFSMPESVLENLAAQAKEAGATLVLRGMKESRLSVTQTAAASVNRAGATWEINPNLFSMFSVTAVPTVVLTGAGSALEEGCPEGASSSCSPRSLYGKVEGDLSIVAALDVMQRRSSSPAVADAARAWRSAILKQREAAATPGGQR